MIVKDNKVSIISEEEYLNIYSNNQFNEKFITELTMKYQDMGYTVVFPIAKMGKKKFGNENLIE